MDIARLRVLWEKTRIEIRIRYLYFEKLGLKICYRKLEEKQSQWLGHIKKEQVY
jgi:hypothetical protein